MRIFLQCAAYGRFSVGVGAPMSWLRGGESDYAHVDERRSALHGPAVTNLNAQVHGPAPRPFVGSP